MNKMIKLFAVILLICSCNKKNTSELIIQTEDGNVTYQVETASTKKELQTGLMYRDHLPADHGMLFDLSPYQDQQTVMWMKDTKLSLDMLFVTREGVIFWIKENAQPYSEEYIRAPFPAYEVIEINGGDIAKNHLKIGNRIVFPLFNQNTATEKNSVKVSEPSKE